jgi:hypothetical protein
VPNYWRSTLPRRYIESERTAPPLLLLALDGQLALRSLHSRRNPPYPLDMWRGGSAPAGNRTEAVEPVACQYTKPYTFKVSEQHTQWQPYLNVRLLSRSLYAFGRCCDQLNQSTVFVVFLATKENSDFIPKLHIALHDALLKFMKFPPQRRPRNQGEGFPSKQRYFSSRRKSIILISMETSHMLRTSVTR